MQPEDLPELVALHRSSFPDAGRRDPHALAEYLERIFLRFPWPDPELHSLVYQDDRGRLAGFLGVIPRRMTFRNQTIRVAVAAPLVVAPETRGIGGWRLTRAFLEGPQDLSYSDTASEATRGIWETLGGRPSLIHSMTWERRLRRGGFAALLGSRAAVPPLGSLPGGMVESADVAALAGELDLALWWRRLAPWYAEGAFRWLLEQAAERPHVGPLRCVLVRDEEREVAGWCCYFAPGDGTGEVVQVVFRPGSARDVLGHLLHHAQSAGLTTLTGRGEPPMLEALAFWQCPLYRKGRFTIYHTRRPEISAAIERGDALLSRLEGDWWLSW